MPTAYFITHPDVVIDPAVPVRDWRLSPHGGNFYSFDVRSGRLHHGWKPIDG